MGIRKRAKSTFEKLVPISPEFYDSNREEDLVAPKIVLLPFNAFLLFAQWVAFVALMIYYSGPSNYVSDTTIKMQYHYGYPQYNCTPMMAHPYWGNTMNYDWCKEEISTRPPGPTTIDNYADADGPWTYQPFSFTNHKALPPKPTLEALGSLDAVSEKTNAIRTRLETIQDCDSVAPFDQLLHAFPLADAPDAAWEIPKYVGWTSEPQQAQMTLAAGCPVVGECTCMVDTFVGPAVSSSGYNPRHECFDGGSACGLMENSACTAQFCFDYTTDLMDRKNQAYNAPAHLNNVSVIWQLRQGALCCDERDEDDALDIWSNTSCYYGWDDVEFDLLTEANAHYSEQCHGDYQCEFATKIFEGYRRGYRRTLCQITPEKAEAMFRAAEEEDLSCGFAQSNVPFSCETSGPPSIPQRFSLAYANSLLLYTVFSTICVKVFFAAGKKDTEEGTEMQEKPASEP